MCPYMIEGICTMVGIEPEHVECASRSRCEGKEWDGCAVYISQFFFDAKGQLVY